MVNFKKTALAVIIALQIALPQSVWAENTESQGQVFDFETEGQMTLVGTTSTVSYEKGQYAKSADDTSIKMATDGVPAIGTGDASISNLFGQLPYDEEKQIFHFSMEFLQEDAKSGMTVKLGEASYWQNREVLKTNPANPQTVTFPGNVTMTQNFGVWNKVDIYFDNSNASQKLPKPYTVFLNGERKTGEINYIYDLRYLFYKIEILHMVNVAGGKTVSSAMQFDNMVFERVESIPQSQDFRPVGEIFNFDDEFSVGEWQSVYLIPTNDGKGAAKLKGSGNPSVMFGQNQLQDTNADGTTAHTIVGGYGSQPKYNKSVHSKFPKDDLAYNGFSQGIHYNTGVTDLAPGDVGHLTFRVARVSDDSVCVNIKSGTMADSDGNTNEEEQSIFEMASDGTSFYGQDADVVIPQGVWAKVDMLYKVGEEDTIVECYIDGVWRLDYELCNETYLNYIGDIYFLSSASRDYVVDDLGFGRFTEATKYDPTESHGITTDDAELLAAIDSTYKVISLPDNYSVASFISKVNEDVKVYASNGEETTTGTMTGCTVEVPSSFGGNTYYDVSGTGFTEDFEGTVSNWNSNANEAGGSFGYVGGQYAKPVSDTSLRMYTSGDSNTYLTVGKTYDAGVKKPTDKYAHYSIEFLQEDTNSGFVVMINNTEKRLYVPLLQTQQSYAGRVNFANNAIKGIIEQKIGVWNKADIYFEYGTNNVTVFLNGVKRTATVPDVKINGVLTPFVADDFTRIDITHEFIQSGGVKQDSAIQFDNIRFERTKYIPEKQDYRHIGESVAFDDGFLMGDGGTYIFPFFAYDGTAATSTYKVTNPALKFLTPANVSFSTGVGGYPSWNKSANFYQSLGSQDDPTEDIQYTTGVTDMGENEYGHLTFMAMKNEGSTSPDIKAYIADNTMSFEDGSTKAGNLSIFEVNDTTVKFFDETADDISFESDRWYKVDIVFKNVNSNTVADCYIDGAQKLSDFEIKSGSVLNYIGDIRFTGGAKGGFLSSATKSYRIDDLAFGVFNNDTICDISSGYEITTDDAFLENAVDNTERKITLSEFYTVYDLKQAANEHITVYNQNGLAVENGMLTNCVVKVSNGFGGGVWYDVELVKSTVRFKIDGVESYELRDGLLSAQIQIGDSIPSGNTLILAYYNADGTLKAVSASDEEADGVITCSLGEVSLTKKGDFVKAYVWSGFDELKPVITPVTMLASSKAIDEENAIYDLYDELVDGVLDEFNAVNTKSGYISINGEMGECTVSPKYENDKLRLAECDALRLVGQSADGASSELVALEDIAAQYNKVITKTDTETVFVGASKAVLTDDNLLKVNARMIYARPDKAELKDLFINEHPRIRLNGEKLKEIKNNYGKVQNVTEWIDYIIGEADKLLSVSPEAYSQAGYYDLMRIADRIRTKVSTLALSYLITDDEDYAQRAWAEIENACGYETWNHDSQELTSTTFLETMALGYDWLYNYLDKDQKEYIIESCRYHILDSAYKLYHGPVKTYETEWATCSHNWSASCNQTIMTAACAFFETDKDFYSDLLMNSLRCYESMLSWFYPSGAWKEGPGYGLGTVLHITWAMSALDYTFGTDFNIKHSPMLDKASDFFIEIAGTEGTNNFNDSDTSAGYTQPSNFYLAQVYNKPSLAAARLYSMEQDNLVPDVYDIVYYDTTMSEAGIDMPLDSYYKGMEIVSMRSSYEDDEATFVSMHSGNNIEAGWHSHLDSGTFIVDMLGERFVKEMGAEDYLNEGMEDHLNQPTKNLITRWSYYMNRPEGHNVFVINPDYSAGQNIETEDMIERFESGVNSAYAITSLSSAYAGYAKSAKRGIKLSDNRKSVTIRDEIKLNDGSNKVWWFMHTDPNTQINVIDDNTAEMTLNGKKVKVMLLTNASSFTLKEMGPEYLTGVNPGGNEQGYYDRNTRGKKLAVEMTASGNLSIQVKLIPANDPNANVPMTDTVLADWSVSN